MATIPPHVTKAESSATSISPSSSAKAEYEVAIAAYRVQIARMKPTRAAYDALFVEHKKMQNYYVELTKETKSQHTTYQQHKRYFVSLTRSLLASSEILRSPPAAIDDSQYLMHATLLYKLDIASRTLKTMILDYKRMDKARDASKKLDKELYTKCEQFYNVVEKDCSALDQLHLKVLEAEKKMGGKSACGMAEGKCVSCIRVQEREARRAAVKAAVAAARATEDTKGKNSNAGGGTMETGAEAKAALDNGLEEGKLKVKAKP